MPPATIPHSIYFVLVDRFANGDPANDGSIDPKDPQAFHGGDLQGVLEHLDHIQGLGFDTVWLSPVWKMRTEKFFEHGAFHGYWVQDPGQVEPRFGDEATLRRLADALHARQMKLVLDMVYNHVSFDSPLKSEHPDWFHPAEPIVHWDDPVEVQTHEVHGLPDLNQDNPEVDAWISGWTRHWMEAVHPDGFRIDAVRHMPVDFLHRLSVDVRSWSNPNFYLLGELFDGDPLVVRDTITAAGLSSAFDFPLHYAMVDVFCKDQPLGRLASVLSLDPLYGDPEKLVTFLDNHDVGRITSACRGDASRIRKALAFLLTARGTPSLYYGTEWGLSGEKEPENRGDMPWTGEPPFASEIRDLLKKRDVLWRRGRTEVLRLDEHTLVLGRRCGPPDCGTERMGTVTLHTGDAPPETKGETLWNEGITVQEVAPLPPPENRTMHLRLEEPQPGVRYHLAGAGPRLGNWKPEKAPVFAENGSLELPMSTAEVVACKLVREENGKFTWEDGPDRYYWGANEEAFLHWGRRP